MTLGVWLWMNYVASKPNISPWRNTPYFPVPPELYVTYFTELWSWSKWFYGPISRSFPCYPWKVIRYTRKCDTKSRALFTTQGPPGCCPLKLGYFLPKVSENHGQFIQFIWTLMLTSKDVWYLGATMLHCERTERNWHCQESKTLVSFSCFSLDIQDSYSSPLLPFFYTYF